MKVKEGFTIISQIIGSTLQITLDLDIQDILSDAGMLWASMGVVPNWKGPLGNDVYLGSMQPFRTGQTLPVPTLTGDILKREMKIIKATGGARSKSKWIRNKELSKWEMESPKPYGKEVAQQISVLSIQHMDASMIATMINRVNEGRKTPLWVLPIHDAIITDARSVRQYHRAINSALADISNHYFLADKIRDGIARDVAKIKKKLSNNPDKIWTVSAEPDNRWRVIHDYVRFLEENQQKYREKNKKAPKKDIEFLNKISGFGWGGARSDISAPLKLTSQQIALTIFAIQTHTDVLVKLDDWIKRAKANRLKNVKKFNNIPLNVN